MSIAPRWNKQGHVPARIHWVIAFSGLCLAVALPVNAASDITLRSARRGVVQAKKVRDADEVFLAAHSRLRYGPAATDYQTTLFVCGEYYFWHGALSAAEEMFSAVVRQYGDSDAAVFAAVYLHRIVATERADELRQELKTRLVAKRAVFPGTGELTFNAGTGSRHRAHFRHDRLEVYRDGLLFERIDY